MSPTGKLDLDTMLGSWPAPERDERAWEERADVIVKAALSASETSGQAPPSALFEAPPLAAEQGEPQASIASAGEKKMSQESDSTAPKSETIPQSAVPSTMASPRPSERKRGSLKEMAARASQSGTATRPPPSSASVPSAPLSKTSATSSPLPVASSAPSRPVEAGKEDSGIVNLSTINEKTTAEQKAAAEKAKPATEGLFDDDAKEKDKPAAAAAVAAVVPITAAKSAAGEPKKKGSSGVVVGGIIAVIGLAAAFAITKVNKPAETPPPAPVAAEVKPATDVKSEPAAQTAPSAAPVAEAPAEPATSAQPEETTAKVAAAPQSGAGNAAPAAPASAAPGGEKPAEPEQVASAALPSTPPKPAGDLKGAMAEAVGSDGSSKSAPTAENAEPASGARNQNIPEQPSQGAVNAAIRPMMDGAKACVAGADDVSRAQIVFSSSGAVSSVSVSGWAASHGASGCIKAAFMGAKVGPFSKSSFSAPVTIRP